MMFKVGDRIVYPMHGAGYIEGTEMQCVGGVQREYYNIQFLGSSVRLKLPVQSGGSIRLRPIMEPEQATKLLRYFEELVIDTEVPWGKRYKENVERLKTGIPEETAEVVKTLMLRDKEVGLSIGDRQVMLTAKNILSAELALALGREQEELKAELNKMVEQAMNQ